MSLAGIVKALGGELYAGGRRALVRAPGHSAADRSVSLLLDGDRVVVHGFGGADWRTVRDELRRLGLVDAAGRLVGAGGGGAADGPAPRAPPRARIEAAVRLWAAARPLGQDPAARYCAGRGATPPWPAALRHHPAVCAAVYARRGVVRDALLAAVRGPGGDVCGVEVTYVTPEGRRPRMATPRKVIGVVPPGAAVRLAHPAPRFLVAEGVFTTLAAMRRFGRPGWALLSTGNLRRWSPPPGVRDVIVAGDRGPDGERSAEVLARRLRGLGLGCEVRLPPPGFGDWDEVLRSEARTPPHRRVTAPSRPGQGP